MYLQYLNRDEYKDWDNFVDSSDEGSIFSKSWYLDALNIDYKILVVKKDNIIKAGIVLAQNEIKLYSNPMFAKYLGILYCHLEGNRHKIISMKYKCSNLLSKELQKYISFDYYFSPNFKNWIPLYWKEFNAQIRYTYIIDNSKDLDEIYNGFQSKIIKRNISYAKRNGVEVKEDISFEIFWELVNKTYLRQGSKAPFSKNRIKKYIESLEKRGAFKSFGAYNKEGECIAVCGLVYESKASYLLFDGIDNQKMVRGANALIIWESIKYFHSKCAFYDFEGSMLKGVEPFIRKFGGELKSYYRVYNDNFFNFFKTKSKKAYKKMRYGR